MYLLHGLCPVLTAFFWKKAVSFVKWKVSFLLASLDSLRKYSSFVIVKAINEEKLTKKKTSKKVQIKRNCFKSARREEISELCWHMAKIRTKFIRKLSNFNF